jgi:hypothetical protein
MKRLHPLSGAGLQAPLTRFAMAALCGAATPFAYGAVIVDLDATSLPTGPLNAWANKGSLGGSFAPGAANAVPAITAVDTVKGVTFNGTTHFYTGPVAPESVTGANSRTVEAWIYNPAAAGEETIFSWGRRGGGDGSNVSFNHGSNPTFGAVGHWGAPDIGWEGAQKTGRWTYVVYTYDGASQTTTVYSDGVVANTEVLAAPLATHATSTSGAGLPFRIASQNEASGTPTAGLRGSMTIARIRVHDTAIDAAAVTANYNRELTEFGIDDFDNDGLPGYYERRYPAFLSPTNGADGALDFDNDGRTNLQEFQAGTLPDVADTDGDGLNEGAEATAGTNPLNPDTDTDGLADGAEAAKGGNPTIADTDGDGFLDGQEVLHGSNVNGSGSVPNITAPLVNLNATSLPLGNATTWANTGLIGGQFVSPVNTPVTAVAGVKGFTFNGTSQFFRGPASSPWVAGNGARTIEAWIYNPVAADEETIFSWGRRGGPDGSNTSFNHGVNPTWGAVGIWGAPDIGWEGNVAQGQWTHVAYTWDPASLTTTVYKDGVVANSENLTGPLVTHALDTTGRPLPFLVAAQNDADGNTTAGSRGSMTIARLRVHDRALDATAIASQFTAEQDEFGLIDTDTDGLPTWYERQFPGILSPTNGADAAQDGDIDGLTNLEEFTAGTPPNNPDADGDGLTDGAELKRLVAGIGAPTKPLVPDTDQDGILDGAETTTDPLAADSDGDGVLDGQEVARGSNPASAASVPAAGRVGKLVDLGSSSLTTGPLSVWPNSGTLGGGFTADAPPTVESVAGVKGVTFDGTSVMDGPIIPLFVTGDAPRTIDAWIFNPEAADEETIFSIGRRGGPDGSNASFNHGLNGTFGAVGKWGAYDVGWNNQVKVGRWTHVAYTYDPATTTVVVYSDGDPANTVLMPGPLSTHSNDNLPDGGRPLVFRVAGQTDAAGGATAGLRGTMSIARVRVYDAALSAADIKALYTTESATYAPPTLPPEITSAVYDAAADRLTLKWEVPTAGTYNLLGSGDLKAWSPVATGLSGGEYQVTPVANQADRFYRLVRP